MGAPIDISSMTHEISGHLQGCPSHVMEFSLRKMITDLCQRAKVWRVDLDPVALVESPTTAEYALSSPFVYAEVIDVLSVRALINDTWRELRWVPWATIKAEYPDGGLGEPRLFTSGLGSTITVAPSPNMTGAFVVHAVLRPTVSATQWDSDLSREFSRCLFHGVLFDLMSMPNRGWSNAREAAVHGKIWTNMLAEAGWRADTGYTRQALRVEARPFA